jgi:hypothetical protein
MSKRPAAAHHQVASPRRQVGQALFLVGEFAAHHLQLHPLGGGGQGQAGFLLPHQCLGLGHLGVELGFGAAEQRLPGHHRLGRPGQDAVAKAGGRHADARLLGHPDHPRPSSSRPPERRR